MKRDKLKPEEMSFLTDSEEIERRPLPVWGRATLYALFGFILFAILWASVSKVDRVVTARGKIITQATTIVVQPVGTSVIRSLDVKVGDLVRKGQLLGRFDSTFTQSDLSQLETKIEVLEARLRRLEAEIEGAERLEGLGDSSAAKTERHLFEERRAHYQSQVTFFDHEQARLKAALEASRKAVTGLQQRLDAASEVEAMRQQLMDKGSGSRLTLLEAQDRRLSAQAMLRDESNRAQDMEEQIKSKAAERETFISKRSSDILEELTNVRAERDATSEQLNKAQRMRDLEEMRAPADAVVLKVAELSVGSVAREAEPLFTLVPLGSNLEAELQIAAADIGFVREGDAVRIKIDAYPYQKHGHVDGTLRVVSGNAFTVQAGEGTQNAGAAYYHAIVDLEEADLIGVPKGQAFIPGMTLSGEIVVGKRRVISYFLYPVIRSLDASIREP